MLDIYVFMPLPDDESAPFRATGLLALGQHTEGTQALHDKGRYSPGRVLGVALLDLLRLSNSGEDEKGGGAGLVAELDVGVETVPDHDSAGEVEVSPGVQR